MLGSSELMVFVPTANAGRAGAFKATLGLRCIADEPYALVLGARGTMLRIQNVQALTCASGAALGWNVAAIASAVRELTRRGVRFDRCEGLEQDELGAWSSGAGRWRGSRTATGTPSR
jgi:hypothetical protein